MHPKYTSPLTGIVINLTEEERNSFLDGQDAGALALSTRIEYATKAFRDIFLDEFDEDKQTAFAELVENLDNMVEAGGYDEMSEDTRLELDRRLVEIQKFLEINGVKIEEYLFELQRIMAEMERDDLKEADAEMKLDGIEPGIFSKYIRDLADDLGIESKKKGPADVIDFDPSKGKGKK
jgi:hypothetical protein